MTDIYMKRLWILGIGPLMVSSQFIHDLPRMDIFLFGKLLSKNIFEATERLYEAFGSTYFFYTCYANQYMGNRAYSVLKGKNHLICTTFSVNIEQGRVEADMTFDVYDNSLQYLKSIVCRSVKTTDEFLIYL